MVTSLPASAAETTTTSSQKNEVVLVRNSGTETIKLPADMSKAELSELKNSIQKYGNQKFSKDEIELINSKVGASGLVYGPWFGGVDKYYAMSVDETVAFFAALGSIVSPFLGWAEVVSVSASNVTSGLCSVIGLHYSIPGSVSQGQWVKADMAKKYREVKYSDGSFAYFQTGFFANNLTVANKSYGSPVTIFSGGLD